MFSFKIAFTAFFTAIVLFFTPPFALMRSMAIMSAVSLVNNKHSVFKSNNFDIKIPGGITTAYTDWYPFVMTFNDNAGFRKLTGDNSLSLSIKYNFPYFSLFNGCSQLFNSASPYLGSFYGVYAVSSSENKPYGFSDNQILNIPEASLIMKYDYINLVLSDFGIPDDKITYKQHITEKSIVSYAGSDNWTKIDAELTVNSPAHNTNGFAISYLQYGKPSFYTADSFTPVKMYGRVYAKYFKEYNSSIFFYIVTPDADVLESCDRDILSKSTIVG